MKNNDHSFWFNLLTKGLTVILMLLVLVKLTGITEKKDDKPKEEQETKEEVKEFRNSEKILWDLFLKEAKEKRYIVEENLESIELIEVVDYGRYLKSKPNIRYEQLNFTYKCKSKTICVSDRFVKSNEYAGNSSALVTIDLTNKEYIVIEKGYSFNINDELVPVEGPFVYEGEES